MNDFVQNAGEATNASFMKVVEPGGSGKPPRRSLGGKNSQGEPAKKKLAEIRRVFKLFVQVEAPLLVGGAPDWSMVPQIGTWCP